MYQALRGGGYKSNLCTCDVTGIKVQTYTLVNMSEHQAWTISIMSFGIH